MSTYTLFVLPLLIGALADLILGDPYFLPHPIRLFGKLISWGDQHFNKGEYRRTKGLLMATTLCLLTWGSFTFFLYVLKPYPVIYIIFASVFVYYGLSARQLVKEAQKVEKKVQNRNLDEARRCLSYIVGRDTSQLSFHKIRVATLETVAENLSDGVVAPIFFYAAGGVPLMMMYKMINTMDSMIGYKNEKYREFGFFAARILDDAFNYFPARLTAFFIWLCKPSRKLYSFIRCYAYSHASPNSGFPESAMAGILDVQFGGPNIYHGQIVDKPNIGINTRDIEHKDLQRAYLVLFIVTCYMLVFVSILRYVLSLLFYSFVS